MLTTLGINIQPRSDASAYLHANKHKNMYFQIITHPVNIQSMKTERCLCPYSDTSEQGDIEIIQDVLHKMFTLYDSAYADNNMGRQNGHHDVAQNLLRAGC